MSRLETSRYCQYGTVYVNINLDVLGSVPNSDAYPRSREDHRAWVEIRNVVAPPPQVVPVRHALMTHSICNLGRNFFVGCLKFSV